MHQIENSIDNISDTEKRSLLLTQVIDNYFVLFYPWHVSTGLKLGAQEILH